MSKYKDSSVYETTVLFVRVKTVAVLVDKAMNPLPPEPPVVRVGPYVVSFEPPLFPLEVPLLTLAVKPVSVVFGEVAVWADDVLSNDVNPNSNVDAPACDAIKLKPTLSKVAVIDLVFMVVCR
jgi:hypothetical protein